MNDERWTAMVYVLGASPMHGAGQDGGGGGGCRRPASRRLRRCSATPWRTVGHVHEMEVVWAIAIPFLAARRWCRHVGEREIVGRQLWVWVWVWVWCGRCR